MDTFKTHDVQNQPQLPGPSNLFLTNLALRDGIAANGAAWAAGELTERGQELGAGPLQEAGTLANKFVPTLKLFDRYGRRTDEVEFHPSYHQLFSYLKRTGMDSAPWADPKPGAHVARAAHFIMYSSIDNGTQCPTTMTYGAIPVVKREAKLAQTWLPKLTSREYDPRFQPVEQKRGAILGMGMTEKQGGSDVRSNSTQAIAQGDGTFRIVGHKWFLSAPMCDGFLVTANSRGGLSCFFVPRWTPDGALNELRIQRLKDKVGDRSNASSEVEFTGAYATLIGEEGRGIPTILEMGTYTRLDCALGTTGLMRFALAEAMHHTHQRRAFGKLLSEQPMMQNVLADLAIETEAATALSLRLARAYDAQNDEYEGLLRRVLTPATKFYVCKRGPAVSAEAMEAFGGIGYVEETVMPRIYRQMPLNSIWEGSGNVMCLDVLRALAKYPKSMDVLRAELGKAAGKNAHFDKFVGGLAASFESMATEGTARVATTKLAQAMQGALLLQHAPAEISETFCASRLGGEHGEIYGTLGAKAPVAGILKRAWPA